MRHLLESVPARGPLGILVSMSDDRQPRTRWVVSVRTRIVAVITLVAAVAMLSVGATVYAVERTRILASIDDRLRANLESARFLVERGDDDTQTWSSPNEALSAVVQRMSPDDNTGALGIIGGAANLVPGVPLDVDLQSQPEFAGFAANAAAEGPVIGTYAEHGVTWRYLAAPIAVEGTTPESSVVFAMVYDVAGELAEIDEAAQAYLIASGIALVVIAGVAMIVSTRLLRPLRTMRETAERVSGQNLSDRLPVHGRDDVSDLATTMNDMLDRLDDALDSQRRLLSDVGHELKTPITIVRGHLEVMDPADERDVVEARELAVDELDRMGRLVQDLAGAAALHGPAPITPTQVDAGDLVRQIARKAQHIDGARVRLGTVADAVATLDSSRITQAVLQLAQNAVTHADGDIVIGSAVIGEALEIWVRDHGDGVPEAAKPLVFDRFHRGPSSDGRGGSGLGLNIVQVIARAHGGFARVEDAPGGGALFTIVLPQAQRRPAASARIVVPPRPPLPPSGRPTHDTGVLPPRPPAPTGAATGPGETATTTPLPTAVLVDLQPTDVLPTTPAPPHPAAPAPGRDPR